jgi:uncharacterized membrane protein
MRSPATLARHPVHPMLVTLPIGLWSFALVCDVVWLLDPTNAHWNVVAYYCIAGGLAGALFAAVPGLIDFLALRDARRRRIARVHLAVNLVLVGLYALNLLLRWYGPPGPIELALSFTGVGLLVLSGWLGAELVHVHRVGVEERSHGGHDPLAPVVVRQPPRGATAHRSGVLH